MVPGSRATWMFEESKPTWNDSGSNIDRRTWLWATERLHGRALLRRLRPKSSSVNLIDAVTHQHSPAIWHNSLEVWLY